MDTKLEDMSKTMLKKRTEAKMMWGYHMYNEWRTAKLADPATYNVRVLRSNLNECKNLAKDDFEYSMCKFVAEVVKVKDGSDYPGRTLYQLCVSIQKYLFVNGIKWKLIEGDFDKLRNVLDNVMKQWAAECIGTTVCRAGFVTQEIDNKMWVDGVLGDENPGQLRETVLFLLGLNVGLCAGDEHYNLRRDTDDLPSQLQFKRNEKGVRCLVYTEDCVTKTNDGSLSSMKKECKVVWVYPSSNTKRCPVRIVDKYMSLLPLVKVGRKSNFYLRSLEKFTPAQWYGEQVVGLCTIRKIMQSLCERAGIQGFFTNHSLRHCGTTRLFQAGIEHKLIKEWTGHASDAVDAYQVTSDEQRQKLSQVIAGSVPANVYSSNKKKQMNDNCMLELSIGEKSSNSNLGCKCGNQSLKVTEVGENGKMIQELLTSHKGCHATVKLQIEFDC